MRAHAVGTPLDQALDSTALQAASVEFGDEGDEFHLFQRRICYGKSTRKWRARIIRAISSNPSTFPGLKANFNAGEAYQLIDGIITTASVITKALHELHGTPDLGNVADPISELIYMILCRRTRIGTARKQLDEIRHRFHDWRDILNTPKDLMPLLKSGGFANQKAKTITQVLRKIQTDFGEISLSQLENSPDEEVLSYLTSLPGIDLKSAQCVMLYSLGRKSFPVDAHTISVLSRLGIFEPLLGDISGLEHRVVQRALLDLVPPRLRGSLHVNAVAHGQLVCRKQRPDCQNCSIRKLCAHWRKTKASPTVRESLVLVDLFSGAGGLSEGFSKEDFRVALAVDSDSASCQTYRLNHPQVPKEKVIEADIASLTMSRGKLRTLVGKRIRVDVLAAGLPCQGFSRVGYRTKPHLKERPTVTGDPRNKLFRDLLRAVEELSPRAVLVENVPDMRSAGTGKKNILTRLEKGLGELGYSVQSFDLNAAQIGLPQVRQRLFVVATKGVKNVPDAKKWILERFGDVQPALAGKTLDGLPQLRPGEGDLILGMGEGQERTLIFNHQARPHNRLDLELFSLMQPGDNSLIALQRGGKRLMRYSTSGFPDKYYRMRADRPARTIVAHLYKDANGFIHPSEDRGITPREAARLQGFTDDYIFLGSRSDHFIQIGNAVPPPVASQFAAYFRSILATPTSKRNTDNEKP